MILPSLFPDTFIVQFLADKIKPQSGRLLKDPAALQPLSDYKLLRNPLLERFYMRNHSDQPISFQRDDSVSSALFNASWSSEPNPSSINTASTSIPPAKR